MVDGVVQGESYADQHDEFHREHGRFTGIAAATGITTPAQPRWYATPGDAKASRVAIEAALTKFWTAACQAGGPKSLPYKYLLARMSAKENEDVEATHFYLSAASGNAAAGPVRFCIRSIHCDELGLDADGHVLLEMGRHHFIATRRGLPFGGDVDRAMFRHLTHWDMAALILQGDRSACPSLRITMELLRHRAVGGDRFCVLGVDAEFPPHELVVGSAVAAAPGGSGRPDDVDWERGLLPTKPADRSRSGGTTGRCYVKQSFCNKHVLLQIIIYLNLPLQIVA